ncbi:protein brambleberry-like [Phlebotomus argentipes]|uniref:protein brambleberry-like n=1 Tax=Phlebotomus argentipes TaxID=94469 RepID=UPI0028935E35|nr:protein brambleberry-like [Phlebotomus argentipes]
MRLVILIFSLFVIFVDVQALGFLDQVIEFIWPANLETVRETSSAGDVPKILFELTPHETTFLEEVLSLSGTKSPSSLDRCQQRVVLKLRKQCREMNEEELGKLSVMLVNCQRQSEGRIVLECSESMSLRDCVSSIDTDAYSAYQTMATRAKAVCIAVGQQQYRLWAEKAVNKLTDFAHEQLQASDRLVEDQRSLQELIDTTSSRIADKEREILTLIDFIRAKSMASVKEASRENSLWMESHKQKIESTLEEFNKFSSDITSTSTLLGSDLEKLHENTLKIAKEISAANTELLEQIEKISSQYRMTLDHLGNIQSTVELLLKTINAWQEDINRNSEWIGSILGGINVYRGLLHAGFLFMGMIILSFIQVDSLSRILFVVTTIGNTLGDLYMDIGLEMPILLSTLVSLIGGKYLVGLVSWRELFYGNAEDTVVQRDERRSVTPQRRNPQESLFTCTAFTAQGNRCPKSTFESGIYCQEHSLRRKYDR